MSNMGADEGESLQSSTPIDMIMENEADVSANFMDIALTKVDPVEAAKLTKQAHRLNIDENDPVWMLVNCYTTARSFHDDTENLIKNARQTVSDMLTKQKKETVRDNLIKAIGIIAMVVLTSYITATMLKDSPSNTIFIQGVEYHIDKSTVFLDKANGGMKYVRVTAIGDGTHSK